MCQFQRSRCILFLVMTSMFCFAVELATAQTNQPDVQNESECAIDLTNPGQMKDIVSNVLLLSEERPEEEVKAFLKDAESIYSTGDELLRAAARHFKITDERMVAEVSRLRHINCTHGSVAGEAAGAPRIRKETTGPVVLSRFARDVTLHVILHEMGHALIREFDLPILGNEETMADAFATYYLTTYFPERAADVLKARVTSLMIEAREVPREQWPVNGEHDSDARRAFQIAALAVASDSEKYADVAIAAGMSEDDIRKAKDYGAEIHRSWRRMVTPLLMPAEMLSKEGRVAADSNAESFSTGEGAELLKELESAMTRFDWHSQVTIRFVNGDGGANWSRSKRTITVNSGYLQRFIDQGKIAEIADVQKLPPSK
jgi:Putative metallopeptidase